MVRIGFLGGALVVVLGALHADALAQGKVKFSDPAVESALKKGMDFLWSRQKGDGSWAGYGDRDDKGKAKDDKLANPAGPTALICYALLEAEVHPYKDKRLAKALDWLAAQKTTRVYTLALRCNVWVAANPLTNQKYLKNLEEDARLLEKSHRSGAYCYYTSDDNDFAKDKTDNSNAQYGLLGVWAGERGSVEIHKEYWETVLKYWIRTQLNDGGWRYEQQGNEGRTTGPMTAAGVASLFVCYDYLYADFFRDPKKRVELPAKQCIDKGLEWFDKNFVQSLNGDMGHGDRYYYLYGVERVGLASGMKYFGKADWYKLGVATLLEHQNDQGAFTGGNRPDEISTAFALLFLVRGRHSVLFNKLEREGDWNNRPRDLATLTRWFNRTLETTVNWQVINLKVPVREWHDAPILYIAGCDPPKFSDEDIDKLRTFVHQGGMLLTCTEGDGQFKTGIREVYKKLFPKYELAAVPTEHDLYRHTVRYDLPGRPKFYMVSNGVRPFAIHLDEDVAMRWQMGKVSTERWAFEAAANVFMYATDMKQLRYRGVSLWPEQAQFDAARTVKLARLQHSGDYDPEPLAYERFAVLLGKETKVKLEVVPPAPIASLGAGGAQVATLTGTGPLKLTDEEKAALRKYVEDGGTLVIDAAGGATQFAESVEQMLLGMYGPDSLRALDTSSPIYQLKGMEINEVKYRRQARKLMGDKARPSLQAVFVKGRPAIIYSAQDLTSGLVGCPAYPCVGYAPDSAYQLMRNIVLTAGSAEVKGKTEPPKDKPAGSK
jgi:hypothetical protein